jgi:membrane protein YqaA with SNARE-associated domain
MKSTTTKLYNWATQKANSTHAPLWIALLFSLELILFIPLDAILMFFCMQNPRKTFLYVLIAGFASTLSGIAGYLLGHFLWDLLAPYIIPHLISAALFDRISGHFHLYEGWAVFFGSLLPFPLKALSLAAGVFHPGILLFSSLLLSARLLRFAFVGGAIAIGGAPLKNFVDKHFHRIILVVGAKIAAAFLFFWALAR